MVQISSLDHRYLLKWLERRVQVILVFSVRLTSCFTNNLIYLPWKILIILGFNVIIFT